MADETKLSFRERQDLKGNTPGINDEMKAKVESLLEQIKTLNDDLSAAELKLKNAQEQDKVNMKELSDQIQSLTTENSELGSKLKDAELKLSEFTKPAVVEETSKEVSINADADKENKVPDKNPNLRRK